MDHFSYREGRLLCDGVPAAELAGRYGTPLYVYCARTILHHYQAIADAFAAAESAPLICYSVKANSNLSILRLLENAGAGFDVVSGGELRRVLEVGGDPGRVVFAGVGKTVEEIDAALDAGIFLINVESESELHRIDARARARGAAASVAIRVNPDIDPRTHRYITTGKRENKFGVDLERADALLRRAADLEGIECRGLHIHVGSQITDTRPHEEGVRQLLDYVEGSSLARDRIRWLDVGGGFGAHYRAREALPASAFADTILPLLEGRGLRLILEPGRFIVANAGILLTRVVTRKESGGRIFAICDAGMNDLLRPALYRTYHRIWPVEAEGPPPAPEDRHGAGEPEVPRTPRGLTDVVGPICESGDYLGLDRDIPAVEEGDLLAVFSAGAYGFSMASNYNSRPRPAEALVDGEAHRLIRRREAYEDLVKGERDLS